MLKLICTVKRKGLVIGMSTGSAETYLWLGFARYRLVKHRLYSLLRLSHNGGHFVFIYSVDKGLIKLVIVYVYCVE